MADQPLAEEPALFVLDRDKGTDRKPALDPPDPGRPEPRPAPQGRPARPIQVGGGARAAEQMVQVAWNAQHEIPWHWPVPAYLVTKGIGAGIFIFLTLGWATGAFDFDLTALLAGGALSIVATLATTALLVYDLERPERFLSILYRPQWKSWLTRGAYLLVGFSTLSGLWWALEAAAALGLADTPSAITRGLLSWLTLPLAVGAAIYTAWLFAQAEGRDLWQSPLLPLHLLVQALLMGTGGLLLVDVIFSIDPGITAAARTGFGAALITDLMMMLFGELGVPHASEIAARAAHEISHGRYSSQFWWGAVVLGHVAPLLLLATGFTFLAGIAALCAGVGLYLYEHAFVMAPQEIPNS